MRIVNGIVEIENVVIKAMFLGQNVGMKGYLINGRGYYAADIARNYHIFVTPQQITPLIKPVEGEWCFQILGADMVIGVVRYHRTDEVMYSKLGSFIALNTFTLQAEKEGILREIVEMCKEVI